MYFESLAVVEAVLRTAATDHEVQNADDFKNANDFENADVPTDLLTSPPGLLARRRQTAGQARPAIHTAPIWPPYGPRMAPYAPPPYAPHMAPYAPRMISK